MDDWYRALSISKDEDLEPYLKMQSNSCFDNNYFESLAGKYGHTACFK